MVFSTVLLLATRLGVLTDSSAVCYALHVDPWSLASYASLRLPAVVRLYPGAAAGGGPLRPDLDRRPFPGLPDWHRVGADSLALRWSDGFTGVVLRARVVGDSLRGVAETFSDDRGTPQASATVAGARTACPAAPAG